MLRPSEVPLTQRHDLFMLDLDGVVYVGPHAVPGVDRHVRDIRAAGARVAFVTNNASRTPATVAGHLTGLGVAAAADDVVTSAQAAAALLRSRHGHGARILALGGEGLVWALESEGLVPVLDVESEDVVALATGYGPDVLWRHVMACAVRVSQGLEWVASNTDLSIPTPRGIAPGHGMLVRMLSEFSGVEPTVAGKPSRPLLDVTASRVGGATPLMIGDRLDTDILGAHNAQVTSLLVLTGVTDLAELVAAPTALRPHHISPTLAGAFEAHGVPARVGEQWELGGWRGEVSAGLLRIEGSGSPGDWWRVAAVTGWSHLDATGGPVVVDGLAPPRTVDGA